MPVTVALALALTVTACGGGASKSASSGVIAGLSPARGAAGAGDHATTAAPAGSGIASSGTAGGAATAGGTAAQAAGGPALGRSPDRLGARVIPAQPDVIETATIALRVADDRHLHRALDAARVLAQRDGGYVASSVLHDGRGPSASVTLRIPDADESAAVQTIEATGTVSSSSFTGQDVTGQVVDLATEIANLRSEEAAVRKLLGQAASVADILTIQQQLFALQGQIQELTAQQSSVANQVRYATISVDLSAPGPVTTVHRSVHPSTLTRFWRLASSHTTGAVRAVFLGIGWSAPLLIAGLVAGAGFAVLRRRRHALRSHES